ncbi:MAG: manganese-dependent inorganic pyrophosphatase [Bacilli bacterium]
MTKIAVFGHKNPDTDTICSALAYAHLKQAKGVDAVAVRLGSVNLETQYALDYFGVTAPELAESVSAVAKDVILVDHNERQQSANDIAEVRVIEVIDHHRIANFETAEPLYYRCEPVGCTATILNKMYKEQGVAIPKAIAGLMLSAIVSDSLLFKSPTCTEEDVQAAKELAEIAGVNVDEYGLAMLKAGADLSKKTLDELVSLDAKEFAMGTSKVEIAQVNAVDVQDVLGRKDEVMAKLEGIVADKGLDLFLFVVTNILTNDSTAVAVGARTDAVESAFGVTLEANEAVLAGVVSRKKQIVPVLTEAFAK